jgi:hypothetical protein
MSYIFCMASEADLVALGLSACADQMIDQFAADLVGIVEVIVDRVGGRVDPLPFPHRLKQTIGKGLLLGFSQLHCANSTQAEYLGSCPRAAFWKAALTAVPIGPG